MVALIPAQPQSVPWMIELGTLRLKPLSTIPSPRDCMVDRDTPSFHIHVPMMPRPSTGVPWGEWATYPKVYQWYWHALAVGPQGCAGIIMGLHLVTALRYSFAHHTCTEDIE